MTLDDYLTIWAEWMHDEHHDTVALAKTFDNAGTNFAVCETDPATQADDREYGYGEIIDACIDSLPRDQRLAIHHVFGLSRAERLVDLNAGIVYVGCLPRLAELVARRLPLEPDDVSIEKRQRRKIA